MSIKSALVQDIRDKVPCIVSCYYKYLINATFHLHDMFPYLLHVLCQNFALSYHVYLVYFGLYLMSNCHLKCECAINFEALMLNWYWNAIKKPKLDLGLLIVLNFNFPGHFFEVIFSFSWVIVLVLDYFWHCKAHWIINSYHCSKLEINIMLQNR